MLWRWWSIGESNITIQRIALEHLSHVTLNLKYLPSKYYTHLDIQTNASQFQFLCSDQLFCFSPLSMQEVYSDQFGWLDFQRSQHGSGMSGRSQVCTFTMFVRFYFCCLQLQLQCTSLNLTFHKRKLSCPAGISDLGPKWVRLTPNGTNLELFQIRFQNILARFFSVLKTKRSALYLNFFYNFSY